MNFKIGHGFVVGQLVRMGRKLYIVTKVLGPFYRLEYYPYSIFTKPEPKKEFTVTTEHLIKLGIVTR